MPTSVFQPSPGDQTPAPTDQEATSPVGGPDFRTAASPVNWALIIGSVAVTVWTSLHENPALYPALGQDRARVDPLLISEWLARSPMWLWEVRHGEFWRLFTPAFLHFSIMHIAFNLLNLAGLGNVLEKRVGSSHYFFLAFVLILGSNLGQYFIANSPGFGGMSGLVYGLFGYVWLRGKTDATFGLGIPQQTVVIALVWFVACFTGVLGPIANMAHAVGLVLGALWGLIDGRAAMTRYRAYIPSL